MQEPDYTAAFVLELPKLLNSSGVFKKVRFGGCFIHKSPIAKFTGKYVKPAGCELGDLLAIVHTVVDGDDRYNATLLQWKKTTSLPCVLSSPGELKQLDLYEHWPEFSLSSKGGTFDIYPKTVTPGAQYGLILPGTQTVINCMIPSSSLDVLDSVSFARFIINLMKWHTGRPFVLDSTDSSDSWSLLISKLISSSRSKAFSRDNIQKPASNRANLDFLSCLKDQDPIKLDVDAVEHEAISILYIDFA